MIGRIAEVEAAVSLLGTGGVRLLTITGPGGVGKTRVALEIGKRLKATIEDGVVFVPLAHVPHGGLLMSIVAKKLGLISAEQPQTGYVGDHLGGRCMLLILDNFEHLIEGGPSIGVRRCRAIRTK